MNVKRSRFPRTFWAANTLELFERWAYYGVFNLLALYLTGSRETGALEFTQMEKGLIMGIVNAILYFLPVITGSIADRFGFKKVLITAFAILAAGYYLMGQFTSFAGIFITFFFVAIGAALFKPVIAASIAKTTDETNSSVGFGLFYMIINIGGLIGPLVASELREISWQYMFLMSSTAIMINLVIVIIFYKEPQREAIAEPVGKSMKRVFQNIYIALQDVKFTLFLLIIVAGWTVYWQYFYSLPVYIDQWIETRVITDSIARILPGFASVISSENGVILAEKLIALDELFIVALQLLVSALLVRFKPINTMIAGFLVNAIGITLCLLTRNGWFLVLSIFIFSLGEMAFSPKILEYIGRLAPRDKTALYMGANFLPMAVGNFFAGLFSGKIYEITADKYIMLGKEVSNWGLKLPEISETFTRTDYLEAAAEMMGMDVPSLTEYLWLNYNPPLYGVILLSLGALCSLLLIIYDKIIFRYR